MSKLTKCGLAPALDIVGGKWKALIVWTLIRAPRRFNELGRELSGISNRMLVQSLRELESDGVILRQNFYEIPPRVDYSLTEFGRSLAAALAPLSDWGARHEGRIKASKATREG